MDFKRKLALFSVLVAAFGLIAVNASFAIEKSIRSPSPMGFELMPMRAWVLPGGDSNMRSGYYEYFTVDIRESDLSAEIEAPRYESVFPAGPEMPRIKSKK